MSQSTAAARIQCILHAREEVEGDGGAMRAIWGWAGVGGESRWN